MNKYSVNVYGYGGEIVIGKISKKAYEYWKERELEGVDTLDDYNGDWDEEMNVPEEYKIFHPGEWHECDDVAHSCGAEMCSSTFITVTNEDDDEIWSCTAEPYELEERGVDCEEMEEIYLSELEPGTCAFIGQATEKGTFFCAPLDIESEFDPSKLQITYNDINGWCLLNGIAYDGEDIYNDDYSTTGKGMYFDLYEIESDEEAA
jgi:hypothetical protein